jgi:O-antigen/teichoic acid export membrane protein
MEVMMALSFAMAWGIFAIALDFAPAFFGKDFSYSGVVMMGLAPSVICQSWANVIRTQYLIPNHHDRSYIISVLLGALVNLVLNALLIPRMAAMGAVIGTVCAEAVVCISQTFMVRRELEISRYLKATLPFPLLGFGMFVLIRLVRICFSSPAVTVVIQVVIGICFYTAASAVYLAFSHRELFRSFLRKFEKKK